MKQYLFIILFFLIPFFSKGQRGTNPVRYQVTVSTGIPMSTPSIVPFTLEGRVLYSFSSRFAAGVGTGFSLYDKEALIPLTGNLQFNLLKPGRFTPFLDCAAGYSFAPASKVDGGFYLFPSVGVRMNLLSDKEMLFSLGYGLQDLKYLREYSTPYLDSSYEESLSFHSLSFKLGIVF